MTIILIFVFALVGFCVFLKAAIDAARARLSESWPHADANVHDVRFRFYRQEETTYEVEAKYSYQVNGRTYESSRIAFGYRADCCQFVHQDLFNDLDSGKAILVYYNRSKPSNAVLRPGLNNLNRDLKQRLVFGAALFVSFSVIMAAMIGNFIHNHGNEPIWQYYSHPGSGGD